MHVFVINLDRDRERLTRMVDEAKRAGVSFERFSAADGSRLGDDLRDQFYSGGAPHEAALTDGEIGCYASHLSVHRLLADKAAEFALVLEDDVRLTEDLIPIIEAAVASVDRWDIIRLSNATKSTFRPVASLGGGRELVQYWTVPNGSGAYLISRAGAAKFARAREKRTLPIDEDLRRPWRSGLITFGVLPPPVQPDVLDHSSIDSTGRDRRLSARARFRDAAPWRDLVPQFRYRLATFGLIGFYRAFARDLAASTVKRFRGRAFAAELYRLPLYCFLIPGCM